MIEWRGVIGTVLVHGAAVAGWPMLDLTTTTCLCSMPGPDVVQTYDMLPVRRISVVPASLQPDAPIPSILRMAKPCGGPADRTPILLSAPHVPASMSTGGPVAFCAAVDETGRVTGLALLRSGDHSRQSLARMRQLLRQVRFKAPVRDGRAIDSRVEIALAT